MMTGAVVRRSLQVAGLAAGIVMFAGGVAQASGPAGDGPVEHSSADTGQGATNVCGNNFGDGGIVINTGDCNATNAAVTGGHGHADVDQGATNFCGNNYGDGGIVINTTDCDAMDAAAQIGY